MTVNVPGRPMTVPPPVRERGPSPWEGERLRPLSRLQIEDRLQELGDLYAETSGGDHRSWHRARYGFLRRLAVDIRRPGFALLIAENTTLTACAYGFPVCGHGPWWQGFDSRLPRDLYGLAVTGRLFAVSGIVVPSRVRTQYQDRDWNLARRLQRRLLTDHGAALGVTLVRRSDAGTVEAYLSWGWRDVTADAQPCGPVLPGPWRLLILGR
jgi:hypothetical protein